MPATFHEYSPSHGKIIGPDGQPWQKTEGYEAGYALPHVIQFSSVIGSAWRSYYHGQHDDSLRNDPEFAIAMERDPLAMAMIQERAKATVNRKWHIEVNDERNPAQKAVANGLKIILDQMPHKQQLFSYMVEGAIWQGRHGAQLKYVDRVMNLPSIAQNGQKVSVKVPVPVGHEPVYGDKINYQYDGTPTIQIYNPKADAIPGAAITNTTASRAIALVGSWRSRFIIHQHEIRDAPYWMANRAGSIYGVGVRHTIYWMAWLKRELLAHILTYAERTGMGVKLWKYQAGNPESKRQVEAAAYEQSDRTNIMVPVNMSSAGRPIEGVEFVETGSSMSTLLLEILRHMDDEIERFIVGQSLSSGTEGAGLGGTGVASLHASTKANLTEYDASNFGETLTSDLVIKLARWIYPADLIDEAMPRWVFDVSPPSPSEILSAVNAAWSMGVSFEEASLRSVTGMPAPQDGDTVISTIALQKAQLDLQSQAQQEQAQQQLAMGVHPSQQQPAGGKGQPGEEQADPTEEDFAKVMSQLTGEEPQRNSRNGSMVRYGAGYDGPHIGPSGRSFWVSRSNPNDKVYGDQNPDRSVPGSESPSDVSARMSPVAKQPKPPQGQAGASTATQPVDPQLPRQVAAMLHKTLGESATMVVHQLIQRLQTDPQQSGLLAAAQAIRDALEPNEDDHEEVRQRIMGPQQHERNGHPRRFAMPGILEDIFRADAARNPKGPMKLPHQAIAEEAMSRLGGDAHAKAMDVQNDLAAESESDDTRHHPLLVANRVADHIGRMAKV